MRKMRNEVAQEFLSALLGSDVVPDDLVLEVRAVRGKEDVHRQFLTRVSDLRVDIYDPQTKVWFGPGLRRAGAGGGRQAVARLVALWADVDGVGAPPRAPVPPTYVVQSGPRGYHLYWRLDPHLVIDEPSQLAWAEEVLLGLARSVGGDPAARDVARMMGLPGTHNPGGHGQVYDPPFLREVVHHDLRAVYRWEDFSRFRLAAQGPDVRALRVSDRIKELILSGWHEGCGYPSRSEADAAVVTAMLAAGHTADEVRSVFASYPIGEKTQENGDRYLEHTIRTAIESLGPPVGTVRLHGGALQVLKATGWYTVVPDAPTVVSTLEAPDEVGWELDVNGRRLYVWSNSFSSARELRRALSGATAFLGDDRDAQRLMLWCRDQNAPRRPATRQVGWHDGQVVYPNGTLTEDGSVVASTRVVVVEGPAAEYRLWPASEGSDGLATAFFDAWREIHDRHAVAVLAGWYLAALVAPQVRSFTSTRQFPHVLVHGARGSGKTTLVSILQAIATGVPSPGYLGPEATVFATVRALSDSNCVPVVLDEWRGRQHLHPLLRSAYNAAHEVRGRAGLTVVRFPLTAPVVVVGETAYRDPALLDRTVVLYLDASQRKETALRRVEQMPYHRLNGFLYHHLAATNLQAVWDTAVREVERLLPDLSERQRHAVSVVAFGIRLCRWWDAEKVLRYVLVHRKGQAEVDHTEAQNGVVLEVLRAVSEMIRAEVMQEGVHYALKTDEDGKELLWIVSSLTLPMVEQYYRRYPSELPMDRVAVKHRLKEAIRSGDRVVVREAKFRVSGSKAGIFGFAFDLQAVEEVCGIPAEAFRRPV